MAFAIVKFLESEVKFALGTDRYSFTCRMANFILA